MGLLLVLASGGQGRPSGNCDEQRDSGTSAGASPCRCHCLEPFKALEEMWGVGHVAIAVAELMLNRGTG